MANNIMKLIDDVLKSCDDITMFIAEDKIDMNYIIQFILLLEKLGSEVDRLQSPQVNIDELNEKLNGLLTSFEEKDMMLFSDNLQYEVKPLLEEWKKAI